MSIVIVIKEEVLQIQSDLEQEQNKDEGIRKEGDEI